MNARLIIAAVGGAAITAIVVANLSRTGRTEAQTAARRPLPAASPQAPPGRRSASLGAIERGLNEVVLAVRPTVVSISTALDHTEQPPTTGMQLLQPFRAESVGVGSGIIVGRTGYILTHRQVTQQADQIRVTLFRSGQNTFLARLVAVDPQTNLALFRLPFAGELPVATLGDSSGVGSGDIVMAVGSPFGLTETVTQGIVSAGKRRMLVDGLGLLDLIQTDAATNQGNCGGPLVNIRGEVIGINVAIFSTDTAFSGIGFAIPSNQARTFLQQAVGAVL